MVQPVTQEDTEALKLKDRRGALVASSLRGDRRSMPGMQAGDVIMEFNGKPVTKNDDLSASEGHAPGTTVPMKMVRDGKEMTSSVKVED